MKTATTKKNTDYEENTIYNCLVEASKGKHYKGKGIDTIMDIKKEFDCTTADILKAIGDNGKTIADFKITDKDIEKSQKDDTTFKFEKKVIDPILNTISKHQVYLTKRANLPQLAKLGYMYETLWYAGRVCWGHKGRLSKSETSYDCEDNPKYKIEMVNPKNERIENLVYDAWGMHISDSYDSKPINFEIFRSLVINGRQHELTDFDKKMLKVNKTFDEWVEVLTDPQYKYHSIYKTRKRVLDHMLCTIGNGYGLNKDGFVIKEASGADQDVNLYGDWQNAKFSPEIQAVVDMILAIPQVKETLDEYGVIVDEAIEKEKYKDDEHINDLREMLKKVFNGDKLPADSRFGDRMIDDLTNDEMHDIVNAYIELKFNEENGKKGKKAKKEKSDYHSYYPICDYSIIDIMINKDSQKRGRIKKVHQSYIDAGIEICNDILAHEQEEMDCPYSKGGNVKFAKKFLALVGDKKFQDFVPKEIDKDAIFRQIKKEFAVFKNDAGIEMIISFSDKRKDKYANDSYYVQLLFKPPRVDLPMGFGNSIEYLKNTPIYNMLKTCIYNVTAIDDIKYISFFYEKTPDAIACEITMMLDEERVLHEEDERKSEAAFINDGFMVSYGTQALILDKMNLILITSKSDTLGSTHPHNKEGKDYFSQAKYFNVAVLTDQTWKVILKYNIDERGFNTFRSEGGAIKKYPEIHKWIMEEFKKMKASDPAYGAYNDKTRKGEGKRYLYAFEFMKWLRDNQLEIKIENASSV